MSPAGEILVVPFHSTGHTFPATELSLRLASRGLRVTLFLPTRPSSPLHPNVDVVLFSDPPPPPPAVDPNSSSIHPFPSPPPHLHEDASVEDYLSKRFDESSSACSPSPSASASSPPPLLCAVLDSMMSQHIETFRRYGIPVVSFFTSSGSAAALEHAASKLSPEDLAPTGTFAVPGLPEDMPVTASYFIPPPPPPPPHNSSPLSGASGGGPRPPFEPSHPGYDWALPPPTAGHLHHLRVLQQPFPPSPPPPHGPAASPPPTHPPRPPSKPSEPGSVDDDDATTAPAHGPGGGRGGGPPLGLGETGAAAALLFNTCDELERPFLENLAREAGKPVWGVGPLLPDRFWSAPDGAMISDDATRPNLQQKETTGTTVAESEVRAWLDSQLPASVLYISFGTLVTPFAEELAELAAALEESDRPFIWVLQAGAPHAAGYFPEDLARRARETRRGLVIRGWAPQLAILSHPSTAAFLSHCGWNSTVEALARGVPVLAWPIKGDQLSNAKLVTDRLRVGYPVRTAVAGLLGRVKKEEVVRGIERLMADEGIRDRAQTVRSMFAYGFPESSSTSMDAFVDFVIQLCKEVYS